ncbi:MAG: YggS family pyridoxal phosphate-dependent enzyme [Proteobacteria bacterium]|nr:MAG: YggS family pyridoxal phosphate-dependent enzyme [Pseudomonadota bacterium]
MNLPDLHQNISKIRNRLSNAIHAAQREQDSVKLIAVSKTKPAEAIKAVYDSGQRDFGENYVSEAVEKMSVLKPLDICWHFLGPLQSNKTRLVATHFDWIHSVDRAKIAKRLNEQRPDELPPLNVCLQVNIPAEPTKSGVSSEAELLDLALAVSEMDRLALRGIMAIPAPASDPEQQRAQFKSIAQLLSIPDLPSQITELSMGMSGDMESAVAEGATMVRIGTDIFGARYN